MFDKELNIIWFSKEVYLKNTGLKPHSHNYFHYIYILKGRGKISIADKEFMVVSDDFLLTGINVPHSLLALSEEGLNVIEIKFNIMDPELKNMMLIPQFRLNMENTGIRGKLESMVREGMNKDAFFKEIICAKFAQVLLVTLRESLRSADEKKEVHDVDDEENKYGVLKDVLEYINSNFSEDLNLDFLAKSARMSKYHFIRTFKSICGLTPIQYISNLRISKARELMLYSDLNVTQIAEKSGFNDARYFSQVFKNKEGITPFRYLKTYRRNLYFHLNNS